MSYVAVSGAQIMHGAVPEMHALQFENGVLSVRIHQTTFDQLGHSRFPDEVLTHIVQWAKVEGTDYMELRCNYNEFSKAGFDASYQVLWNATTKLLSQLFNELLYTDIVVMNDAVWQPMMITSIFAAPTGRPGDHAMYVSVVGSVREWLRQNGKEAAAHVTMVMCGAAAQVYPEFGKRSARSTTRMTFNPETGTVGLFASTMTCACIGVVNGGGPEMEHGEPLGFELSAHNLDHAWEQLIILAGVAHFWNLARTGINPVKD